jgi:hypothetical protein
MPLALALDRMAATTEQPLGLGHGLALAFECGAISHSPSQKQALRNLAGFRAVGSPLEDRLVVSHARRQHRRVVLVSQAAVGAAG